MEVKPLENIESFYEIVERHLLLPASATATGASSTSGSKPKGNAVAASSVFAAFAQDYTAQVLVRASFSFRYNSTFSLMLGTAERRNVPLRHPGRVRTYS